MNLFHLLDCRLLEVRDCLNYLPTPSAQLLPGGGCPINVCWTKMRQILLGNNTSESGNSYDLSWVSLVAQWERICLQCRSHGFNPWVRKILWGRAWMLSPVFLPGESHDRGAWWVTVQGLQRVGHNLSNKCTHSHTHMVSLCPYWFHG